MENFNHCHYNFILHIGIFIMPHFRFPPPPNLYILKKSSLVKSGMTKMVPTPPPSLKLIHFTRKKKIESMIPTRACHKMWYASSNVLNVLMETILLKPICIRMNWHKKKIKERNTQSLMRKYFFMKQPLYHWSHSPYPPGTSMQYLQKTSMRTKVCNFTRH